MTNKHEEMSLILQSIKVIGFEATLYSEYSEKVENIHFQKLRDGYIAARERLYKYIEKHSNE